MSELGTCHKDQYLEASYNGVRFTAIEASSEHGRRTAIGEFPFDGTAAADMGRRNRRYSFSARLDENDHQVRAVALIAACELPGPGILVHPTRGVLNVTCTDLRVRNRLIEGQGITEVDMVFEEMNLWTNGFGLVGSLLGLVLRPLLEASSDQFRSTYNVRSEPVYRQEAVIDLAQDAAREYATEYERAGDGDPRASADLRQIGDDEVLAIDPVIMDMLVRKGSAAVSQQSSSAQRRYAAFRRISNWAVNADDTGTTSGAALVDHIRITAGGYMAQSALDRRYGTVAEALAALDQTLLVLNQEANIAYENCDNNLFLTLRQFIADFTRQMYSVAYGRPQIIEYNFGGAVSPLVAAYAIWDDATRSRDLSDQAMIGPIVQAAP